MRPYIPAIISFLDIVASDPDRENSVLSSAVGLIGDLAQNMVEYMVPYAGVPCIQQLLTQGLFFPDFELLFFLLTGMCN